MEKKKNAQPRVGCRPCESEWREEGGERREEGKMWRKVFGIGGEKKKNWGVVGRAKWSFGKEREEWEEKN